MSRNLEGTEVRAERSDDAAAVRAVHEAAFERAAEAVLVDALRARARPVVSLVAEVDGAIVGHVMLAPVALPDHPDVRLMGLAPVGVLPAHQRRGVGSALVRAGLDESRRRGAGAVVVLGHPAYYPRFGFVPAARFGLGCEYDAPAEAFMALEIRSGHLAGVSGTVRYHAAFRDLEA